MSSLKQVRAQVYAVNTEELFLVDMTIGAPVLGGNVRPVAAVHGGGRPADGARRMPSGNWRRNCCNAQGR